MRYRLLDDENIAQQEIQKQPVLKQSEERPTSKSFTEYMKNILTQYVSGMATGFGGSYGDILDLLGLQSEEILPGEEERYKREHAYSPEQMAAVGTEDDILPSYSRLPSSEEVQQLQRKIGVPAPTGFGGKLAQRVGQIQGTGGAFGQLGFTVPVIAGTVGQLLEEAGAPKWLQAVGEIGAFIKTAPKSMPVASRTKEINKKISQLRKSGLSEEDITLAKNALEDRGWLKKSSRLSPESQKQFERFAANTEQAIKETYEKGLPGLKEGGIEKLESITNNLMNEIESTARGVPISNSKPLEKALLKSKEEMGRSVANTKEEKEVLEIFDEALDFLKENKTFPADYAVNFYRKMNKIGRWIDPSKKEVILHDIKNSIKETFNANGKKGQIFNKRYFEPGNKAYQKFLNAEEAVGFLDSVMIPEGGINFRKLKTITNDPKKFGIIEKAIGSENAQNLRQMSLTASEVSELEKAMKGGAVKEAMGAGKMLSVATALFTGNFSPLKVYVSAATASRLSEKLLTDPSWQNLREKFAKAVLTQSPKSIRSISRSIEKKFDEETTKTDRPDKPGKQRYRLLED